MPQQGFNDEFQVFVLDRIVTAIWSKSQIVIIIEQVDFADLLYITGIAVDCLRVG